MKDFQGKVAVVTGAASGIRRALAGKSAQEGMEGVCRGELNYTQANGAYSDKAR